MLLSNVFGNVVSELKSRVNFVLEKLYIFSRVKDIKSKANSIVTEAEISAQSEMVKRTLAERERKIVAGLSSQREVREVKEQVRQGVYRGLKGRKSEGKEKSKAGEFYRGRK
jgi:hypothetical protein